MTPPQKKNMNFVLISIIKTYFVFKRLSDLHTNFIKCYINYETVTVTFNEVRMQIGGQPLEDKIYLNYRNKFFSIR